MTKKEKIIKKLIREYHDSNDYQERLSIFRNMQDVFLYAGRDGFIDHYAEVFEIE